MVPGPEDVMLLRGGELRQGVWDVKTFTFRVLLGPYGPLPAITTTYKVVAPNVPLLKPLHVLRLVFGSFGLVSLLEYLKLVFRDCRIILYNLGVGFLFVDDPCFHPCFLGGQHVAKLGHGVFVYLLHCRVLIWIFIILLIPAREQEYLVKLLYELLIFSIFCSFSILMVAVVRTMQPI